MEPLIETPAELFPSVVSSSSQRREQTSYVLFRAHPSQGKKNRKNVSPTAGWRSSVNLGELRSTVPSG